MRMGCMGWLAGTAAVLFLVAGTIAAFSLCRIAGEEDDDEEQMKWLREYEERHRKKRRRGRKRNKAGKWKCSRKHSNDGDAD